MKKREREVARLFLDLYPQLGDLQESSKYDHYDFESRDYLIEIKSREALYEDWLIENYKVKKNLQECLIKGKQFLYLTEHEWIAYLWNVSKLTDSNYDFKWEHRDMPKSTQFGDSGNKIPKLVGYLSTGCSKEINLIEIIQE